MLNVERNPGNKAGRHSVQKRSERLTQFQTWGFVASSVERESYWQREGHKFKPRQSLLFFRAKLQLLKSRACMYHLSYIYLNVQRAERQSETPSSFSWGKLVAGITTQYSFVERTPVFKWHHLTIEQRCWAGYHCLQLSSNGRPHDLRFLKKNEQLFNSEGIFRYICHQRAFPDIQLVK